MKLIMPCETATKYLLPALRACVATNLAKKHNLNQIEIALTLGVSQPAVSKYLTGSYDKKVKKLITDEKIKKHANSLAKDIANKKLDKEEIVDTMLKICDDLVDYYPDLE